MLVDIAFLTQPPAGAGPKIIDILELAAAQEVPLHVLKRALDFSFRFSPPAPADDWTAAIMGNESGECRMDHRPTRLPAQDDRFLTVGETLGGRTGEMREGILMAADQGEKIPLRGEVDKMSPGETKDVGETLYGGFAGLKELEGVRAPVHLSLKAGLCLKADHGRFLGGGPKTPKPIPEEADAAVITGSPEFFKEPLTGNPRIFLQEPLSRLFKGIELLGSLGRASPSIRKQKIMTLIPQIIVISQDAPHQVAADGEKPGKRPDRPALLGFHDNQPLF
jgi:hypothetical protein